MKRLLLWLPLAVFVAFIVTVAVGLRKPADSPIRSHMIGKPMPDFALEPAVPATRRSPPPTCVRASRAWSTSSPAGACPARPRLPN
jgi:hypothetical protein